MDQFFRFIIWIEGLFNSKQLWI